MAKKTIVDAINAQVGREFQAAYLYLSMSAYFDGQNLPGFAHWMRLQYQEELGHALRLFDYLGAIGEVPELQAVKKPTKEWKSPLAAVQDALKHERAVTKAINALYQLAAQEKDYPTTLHLQWFVTEQLEEEKTFNDLIARMKMAGTSGTALLLVDREVGARTGE